MKGFPMSSSFVSSQEVPTPPISNCTSPKSLPPPLELSAITPHPVEAEIFRTLHPENRRKLFSNDSRHQSTPQPPRLPRFSSPTTSPIVVERPLRAVDHHETPACTMPRGASSASVGLGSQPLLAPNQGTFLPNRPFQATDWSCLDTMVPDLPHAVKATDHDWLCYILPWLLSCDLCRSGVPWKVIRALAIRLKLRILHPPRGSLRYRRTADVIGSHDGLTEGRVHFNNFRRLSNDDPVSFSVRNIVGIHNYGETCFLNSVLQALASLQPMLVYLECLLQRQAHVGNTVRSDDNLQNRQKAPTDFVRRLLEILDEINGNPQNQNRMSSIDPRPLLQRIGETNSQFERSQLHEQQDAQELLQAILGVVIADAKLDCASSSDRFLRDHDGRDNTDTGGPGQRSYGSDDETLTAVVAGDEATYLVDWSPSCSMLGARSSSVLYSNTGESVLSLSGLLQRMDEVRLTNEVTERSPMPKSESAFPKKLRSHSVMPHTQSNIDTATSGDSSNEMLPREEKKQEDFEISLPFAASEENLVLYQATVPTETPGSAQGAEETSTLSGTAASIDSCVRVCGSDHEHDSTSLQIMKSTISSITPSPLSGWLGSTLRCCKCRHVRPIRNAPFLELALVPTSVSDFVSRAHNPKSHPPSPSFSPSPPCSLDQCLADFTSVEKVQGVECRHCTIQNELATLEEESMLLQGAIASMNKRIQKRGGAPSSLDCLLEDKARVDKRLLRLQSLDPDEDDDKGVLDAVLDEKDPLLELAGDGNGREPNKKRLMRGDAKKCLLLTRCPAVLCCHVQRRYFNPLLERMEKCIQYVDFPEILDLSPYCAYSPRTNTPWAAGSLRHSNEREDYQRGKIPYRLQSIIEHRGNAFGGHYVSYRRDQSGKWFRISDFDVTPTTWSQVRNCQAYMLFYEAM